MKLQLAQPALEQAVCALYQRTVAAMEQRGLHQWHWGDYPRPDQIREGIARQSLYVVLEDGEPICAVDLLDDFEPEYDTVNWLFGGRAGTFHRFAIAPERQGQGLGRIVLGEILQILREKGFETLRCDTRSDNLRALRLYESLGMRRSGTVHYPREGEDTPFITLEMPLQDSVPLLPLRMHPAFRGGKLTPWGGEKLRTVFGKEIPEVPTGESLEISCIPGLESTDDTGVTLPELIRRYGAAFAGQYAQQPFPLLLKLIDAAEPLSVQVHPNDEYAARVENGKLGKTEAWLILDAPEGSELVYGIQPGTTLDALQAACEQGAAVEPLLRRVRVKPGDVCFIPAGCVHAIGAGILLYEIQQSSDVTYRFYDWDRVDKNGNRRELHLKKALDVTDLHFRLSPIPAPAGSPAPNAGSARVLDERYFSLDLLHCDGDTSVPAVTSFGMLTALDAGLTIGWQGGALPLRKGESVYLPATCPALTLHGIGRAALSMPK